VDADAEVTTEAVDEEVMEPEADIVDEDDEIILETETTRRANAEPEQV
jgi:hypothetical protein